MTDLSQITRLTQQVLEQNQQLISILQTLAETEAARAQLELDAHGDRWVDAATVAKLLGPKFSRVKIMDDLRAGLFKYGRDYINVSAGGDRASWAFKKTRLEAIYQLTPEKRRIWPVEAA